MEKITRKEYNDLHPDFKWIREDWSYSILKSVDWDTVSIPVKIID